MQKVELDTDGVIEKRENPGVFLMCLKLDSQMCRSTKNYISKILSQQQTRTMIATPMEFLKSNVFSSVVQQFRDHDIENLNISLDVCKKSSVTPMEKFNNSENP